MLLTRTGDSLDLWAYLRGVDTCIDIPLEENYLRIDSNLWHALFKNKNNYSNIFPILNYYLFLFRRFDLNLVPQQGQLNFSVDRK